MNIVWFKRDLRIYDNKALHAASQLPNVLLLYILEPELWQQPDLSHRQYMFLQECLIDLKTSLEKLGHKLIIKTGDALKIFKSLHQEFGIESILSHQETWNGWTFHRDTIIKKWTQKENVPWQEFKQFGVTRKLKNRSNWGLNWYRQMRSPIIQLNSNFHSLGINSEEIPTAESLGLEVDGCIFRQTGGRSVGIKLLNSFLYERGEGYTKEMSSPVTAFNSCSRLSPYIAFGALSIKEIFQSAEQRLSELKKFTPSEKGTWAIGIRSFLSRLRWHCHFIQKLESNPNLEFYNVNKYYNTIRPEEEFNEKYFKAWKDGLTGFPMIDACMRALKAHGWINFRMRAMLMSFASYHLWLNWRRPAIYLATLFTDYEPGIHYSQVQMQSGTTGINAIRIYNPIKQGIDQDPEGVFIREWVPEIANLPQEYIHTPWEYKEGINNYPLPIVDEKVARKKAADILYGIKKKSIS